MFYKIKSIIFIAALISVLSNNARAESFDLLSDDMIQPPSAQSTEAEATSTIQDELGVTNNAMDKVEETIAATEENIEKTVQAIDIADDTGLPIAELSISTPQANPLAEVQDALPMAIEENTTANELLEAYNDSVDTEIFNKMTELEKESALLSLQLKKEKIRNDIDAVKQQRQAAIDQEVARKEAIEEKKREQIQKRQKEMLVEQQKLKDKEIAFEKLRQEKLLNEYKETLLTEKQNWIENNKVLYDDIEKTRAEQIQSFGEIKSKFSNIKKLVEESNMKAISKKQEVVERISALEAQLSVLKSQLSAYQTQNPFAGSAEAAEPTVPLDNLYVITEIRGKDNVLIAKLLNRSGQTFLAQVGTVLQNGYVVEEITDRYVKANRNGSIEFVYFASGASIMEKEPLKKHNKKREKSKDDAINQEEAQSKPKKFNIYTG